jgi:hypothetical protein
MGSSGGDAAEKEKGGGTEAKKGKNGVTKAGEVPLDPAVMQELKQVFLSFPRARSLSL